MWKETEMGRLQEYAYIFPQHSKSMLAYNFQKVMPRFSAPNGYAFDLALVK